MYQDARRLLSGTVTQVDPEAIRKGREAKGLSRADFAALLQVSPQAVEQWETGRTSPKEANALKIREVLAGDPPPTTISQLRAVVEAQAQVLMLLVEEVRERKGEDDELARRLADLEIVLGLRQQR